MNIFEKIAAASVVTDAAKADILAANVLFAVFLLIFTGFFCIRMLSNTKIATVATIAIVAVVGTHHMYQNDWHIPALSVFNAWLVVGAACCAAAATGILLGLAHEEKSDDFVHKKIYWVSLVLLGYGGLVSISHGISL